MRKIIDSEIVLHSAPSVGLEERTLGLLDITYNLVNSYFVHSGRALQEAELRKWSKVLDKFESAKGKGAVEVDLEEEEYSVAVKVMEWMGPISMAYLRDFPKILDMVRAIEST